MSVDTQTSAQNPRRNKVEYIQNTFAFAFLNDAVLAKEDDLFERNYIRDKSIFIHTKEQDLVLNFYRFLKLGKLGHRMALFSTL